MESWYSFLDKRHEDTVALVLALITLLFLIAWFLSSVAEAVYRPLYSRYQRIEKWFSRWIGWS